MNRRASLPGADELFRPTTGRVRPLRDEASTPVGPLEAKEPPTAAASGRTTHDAKITVYLTQEELLAVEQSRLRLRAEFGINVDRGRIVREAVVELLRDLHQTGPDSAIVRRLS